MLFNIHIFVILCVYFTRVVTSVVTFRSTIPGGKPNWRESSEYRDRSAVPRPPRQNTDTSRNSIPHLPTGSRPVKRVFVGFTDQGINRNPDTSADKKGKIGLPIWFSLPVGAAVPISFSDRPGYDDLRLKKTKNSDVPLASDSEKFNVPEDWTKRQNMPINIHSKSFLTEAWNRRKRAINKVSVNKRKIQIIKAPDAKRSGLPKGAPGYKRSSSTWKSGKHRNTEIDKILSKLMIILR